MSHQTYKSGVFCGEVGVCLAGKAFAWTPRNPSDGDAGPSRGPIWAGLGLLALAVLLVLAVPGLAQEEASARVDPSPVEPGEDISLIFRIDSPELAEVVVQERVTCTVTFPDGSERGPCDRTTALAEVRTSGSGAKEYVFDYQAPSAEGTYEVLFEADSTARVLPSSYTASASFDVVEEELDPQVGGSPTDGVPDEGEEVPPGEDGDGAPDEQGTAGDGPGDELALAGADASRAMVSTALATAVLTVTIVANRFPLGGGQR